MTREEATKYFERQLKYLPLGASDTVRRAYELAIEALSSERPKGRWIRISDRPKTYIRRCSNCNRDSYTCFSEKDYDFCPWCGADMRDGEEK